MTRAHRMGQPQSLSHQITDLERQSTQRRRSIRTLVTGIRRKVTARMITPGALVVAAGFGVALEQTSRHEGWSLATVLDAANAGLRLLLWVKPSDTDVP